MFTSADETFLRAFSDQVALAVENARYHQAVVEKERAERELQIAATIQESLLPREWPPTPGYELSATTRASQTVGGDYYTVAPLDRGRSLLAVAERERPPGLLRPCVSPRWIS
jgi:sigma-B regulation protein RsbU (phosphoserine phosphatase)